MYRNSRSESSFKYFPFLFTFRSCSPIKALHASQPAMEVETCTQKEALSGTDELLSITDAAVRAIGSSSQYQLSDAAKRFEGGSMMNFVNTGGVAASIVSAGISPTQSTSMASPASVSTSASDVLRKSPDYSVQDHHSKHDYSMLSDASNTSSILVLERLKKVKVSSKKLREIKSPYDDPSLRVQLEQSSSTLNQCQDSRTAVGVVLSGSNMDNVDSSVATCSQHVPKSDSHKPELGTDTESTIMGKPIPEDLNGKVVHQVTPLLDSGYTTQNIQVIRETGDFGTATGSDLSITEMQTRSLPERAESPLDIVAIQSKMFLTWICTLCLFKVVAFANPPPHVL